MNVRRQRRCAGRAAAGAGLSSGRVWRTAHLGASQVDGPKVIDQLYLDWGAKSLVRFDCGFFIATPQRRAVPPVVRASSRNANKVRDRSYYRYLAIFHLWKRDRAPGAARGGSDPPVQPCRSCLVSTFSPTPRMCELASQINSTSEGSPTPAASQRSQRTHPAPVLTSPFPA